MTALGATSPPPSASTGPDAAAAVACLCPVALAEQRAVCAYKKGVLTTPMTVHVRRTLPCSRHLSQSLASMAKLNDAAQVPILYQLETREERTFNAK